MEKKMSNNTPDYEDNLVIDPEKANELTYDELLGVLSAYFMVVEVSKQELIHINGSKEEMQHALESIKWAIENFLGETEEFIQ